MRLSEASRHTAKSRDPRPSSSPEMHEDGAGLGNSRPRPNVVLICVDQWRGDCLSSQGHPDVETPYLDFLVGNGASATNAYAASPTCVPARMSLMTGLSPQTHRRVGYQDGVTFDIEHTLPGEFKAAGYHTQAIGKMHYWPERNRIGFDDVKLHDGYLHYSRDRERDPAWYDDYLVWLREQEGTSAVEDYLDNGVECNSVVARPWDKAERLHPTNWVVSEAIRWMYRRDPTCPFFLYLSFHRPHAPYDPPQWAFDRYDTGQLREPALGDWADPLMASEQRNWDPTAHAAVYRPRDIQRAMAGYYGHMTHIDGQISRFVQAVGEFNEIPNTYFVFVSDHGDMMGDHHLWRKGYPYEGSARVPLVIAGPGIAPGTTIEQVVELRDLMPTLLDLAGLPVPESVEGRSLVPFLMGSEGGAAAPATPGTEGDAGDAGAGSEGGAAAPATPGAEGDVGDASTVPPATSTPAPWREYLHGEHALFGQSIHWIRFSHYKYVWFSTWDEYQLFDLDADPQELHNVVDQGDYQQVRDQAHGYLVAELRGREEGFVDENGNLTAGRPVGNVLSESHQPQPEGR